MMLQNDIANIVRRNGAVIIRENNRSTNNKLTTDELSVLLELYSFIIREKGSKNET